MWKELYEFGKLRFAELSKDTRGDMAGAIIKMVIALYVFGTIGVSAIVLIANDTSVYGDVDSNVVTIATVLLPLMAVVAVIMLIYKRTAGR